MRKLTEKEFTDLKNKGYLLIDCRASEIFAKGFIKGSINIPTGKHYQKLMDTFVLKDRATLFLIDSQDENELLDQFKRTNLLNVEGYFVLEKEISDLTPDVDMIISVSPFEFSVDLKHEEFVTAIDIRPQENIIKEPIEKTLKKTPEQVILERDILPSNKTCFIFCGDGVTSMCLISYLKKYGLHNFYHVSGGFNEIKKEENIQHINSQ